MKKTRIIGVVVLLSVLGAFGAVYQFYFAEKLEKYRQDEMFKQQLEQTYLDLEEFFDARSPDMLVSEWKSEVQPWTEVRNERAEFFSDGDWYTYDETKDEGGLLRVWYGEKSNQMVYDLYQKASAAGLYAFPPDIRAEFGVPSASDWANANVTEAMVRKALRQLSFGISLCEMLFDGKVKAIDRIEIWEPRQRPKDKGLLTLRTAGVQCQMTMKDFVSMIEDKVMLADRYFEIDHIRLKNPYIAASQNQEPWIQVEFLLTQAKYVGNTGQSGAAGAAGAAGAPAGVDASSAWERMQANRPAPPPIVEPTGFAKAWKWFKRTVLYMN